MTTKQMEKMVSALQESEETNSFKSLVIAYKWYLSAHPADANNSLKELTVSHFKSLFVQLYRETMDKFAKATSYLIDEGERWLFWNNYHSVVEKLNSPEIYSAVGFTQAEIVVMDLILYYHNYVVLTNKK